MINFEILEIANPSMKFIDIDSVVIAVPQQAKYLAIDEISDGIGQMYWFVGKPEYCKEDKKFYSENMAYNEVGIVCNLKYTGDISEVIEIKETL